MSDSLRPVIGQMCELSGLGRPTSVVRRTGGALSAVCEVVTPGRGEPLIVKVYAEEWAWKQPKELFVYGLLEPVVGWATPTIIDAQSADNDTGRAFTVMTRVPGRLLLDVVQDLDRSAVADVYRQLGSLAAAIHGISQDAFGYLVTEIVEPMPTNVSYLARQFERKLREFRDAGGDAALARRIDGRAAAAAEAFAECRQASLCHNDLHEGNLLVEEVDGRWQLRGVIDVENAIAADPLLDLAKTDCYSIRGDATKWEALADGYGPVVRQAEERLALYRIYHTLELWDWFSQVGEHQHLAGLTRQLEALTSSGRLAGEANYLS